MSATPAARLARLKVTYPAWTITRVTTPHYDGLSATRPGQGRLNAATVALLAVKLHESEWRPR